MKNENLAGVIIIDPSNQFYLTGFEIITYSRPIITLITQDESILIVPGLEENNAKKQAHYTQLHVYYEHPEKRSEYKDSTTYLLELLPSLIEGKTLGVESNSISYSISELLKEKGWDFYRLDELYIFKNSLENGRAI